MGYTSVSVLFTLAACTILQPHLAHSQEIGDFRFSGSCSGTLEVYRDTILGRRFYDICDRNFGDQEAQVVCRQFGCNPVNARRTFSGPGLSSFFVREGYSCNGSESSLSSCRRTSGSCSVGSTITQQNRGQFVTISCRGSQEQNGRSGGSNNGVSTTLASTSVLLFCLFAWAITSFNIELDVNTAL